jgi:hypothetical protein
MPHHKKEKKQLVGYRPVLDVRSLNEELTYLSIISGL